MSKFGSAVQIASFAIKGELSKRRCEELTYKIVKTMKMTCISGQMICNYPYEGKGGSGFTLLQPIAESFIAFDVYDNCEGGYLFIVSCKQFSIQAVVNLLMKEGLHVTSHNFSELSLNDGK